MADSNPTQKKAKTMAEPSTVGAEPSSEETTGTVGAKRTVGAEDIPLAVWQKKIFVYVDYVDTLRPVLAHAAGTFDMPMLVWIAKHSEYGLYHRTHTIMVEASRANNFDTINWMLDLGARPAFRRIGMDERGNYEWAKTVIQTAVRYNNMDLLTRLEQLGAFIEPNQLTSDLMTSCIAGDSFEVFEYLVNHHGFPITPQYSWHALYDGAWRILEYLIRQGHPLTGTLEDALDTYVFSETDWGHPPHIWLALALRKSRAQP